MQQQIVQNVRVNAERQQEERIDHIISELNALKEELINLIQEQNKETNNEQSETPQPIRRRTNRSFPLNKSKFLNEEQRDQVLQFASDNKEIIMSQTRSYRIPYLQNLVHEQLNINLSLYMASKLINLLQTT